MASSQESTEVNFSPSPKNSDDSELSVEMSKLFIDNNSADPDFSPSSDDVYRRQIEDELLEKMMLEDQEEAVKKEAEEELLDEARVQQGSKAGHQMKTRSRSRSKNEDSGYNKFIAGMETPKKPAGRGLSRSRGRKALKAPSKSRSRGRRSKSRSKSRSSKKAPKKAQRGRSKSKGRKM